MRYGNFLKKGGVIGFPAPSFGCNIQPYKGAFEHALATFRKKGYKTLPGPNAFLGEGIGISNTPQKCGQELMDMYLSERTDALISCGGGELMCEILDYVDFEAIRKALPKWYMGYSDNTNMTFLLATLCDTAAIYGPCAAAFGMEPWDPAIADAFDLLCGKRSEFEGYDRYEVESLKDEEHPLIPYNRTEPSRIKVFIGGKEKSAGRTGNAVKEDKGRNTEIVKQEEKPGNIEEIEQEGETGNKAEAKKKVKPENAEEKGKTENTGNINNTGNTNNKDNTDNTEPLRLRGRLIGGCLDCLVNLVGTNYDQVEAFSERYKEDGLLWFMESCDLNVFSMRRAIWEMDHAGWFRHVKGFLIGRPLHMGETMMGLDQYHAVVDLLKKYDVPILMDLDIGHLPPMLPLVTGSMAEVTCNPATGTYHICQEFC